MSRALARRVALRRPRLATIEKLEAEIGECDEEMRRAELMAGPRVSQTVPPVIQSTATPIAWERQPDLRASLSYKNRDQLWAIAVGRTQALGFGASGFIDTESVEVRAGRSIGRRLQLSARSGGYRNTLAGLHAMR